MDTAVKLPYEPSELIKLAIADLEKVEESEGYTVNMSAWHGYAPGDKICYVCLAGAVIAMSLGADIGRSVGPEIFDKETTDALYLLDDLRVFHTKENIYMSIQERRSKYTKDKLQPILDLEFWYIPTYSSDPTRFKKAMLYNAAQLASIGL